VPSEEVSHRYVDVRSYSDLPSITREQVEHFFQHYKDLEPEKWVKIQHWGDVTEAKQLLVEAIERAKGKSAPKLTAAS